MQTESSDIDQVIQMAIAAENSVQEISRDWSKVKLVVHMSRPLNNAVRDEIMRRFPTLRHWVAEKTPYSTAEEGFTCDQFKIALSFPLR